MSYNNYDTSYTSYGTGGGAGGGGFIPGDGSQTSPSGRRDFSQDSLRPVTIKQILDAQQPTDEIFKIDGTPIAQLTFVGQIRNISSQTTNITYKLDDGTGSIEVKLWVDSDDLKQPDSSKPKLVENAYCRVWGKPRCFNNKKHVGAHIIRPVEDFNEVSYHLLEATVVHLYFTRGPPGGAAGAAGVAGTAMNGAQGQEQTTASSYASAMGGENLSAYSAMARKVYNHMRVAPQTNEGLHQQEIAASLRAEIVDVARAGDELLTGGLIYTTVDDQTWAVLEAD
ncbi:replication protein A, subunit RPA32 [Lindgomyces ingoldianus]|uniref:Replication protein A, subunit RPA32 n=1 Tax=Lindgomyces ingoldianus TaxID=673940 RepID=A0ACB6QYP8_9PLEO|nr:replication protein A, subunit RPA32 [Lindgomyces ingoldianus]KAF2472143.1 replication protein A, subunit RPA32 [Lindgomyces ingoldianus]